MITENQLDEWVRSNAEKAQAVVVELVWRLVAASCPRPKDRRFPLGDSIGQPGPDGILEVDDSFDPFVPEGRSFWEIGTGEKAQEKATSDYRGLVSGGNAIPENVRLESAFVFVTPLSSRRGWRHTWKEESQGAWLEKRRARHDWRGVRIIDGSKLIDWIHQFPPVELWFAEQILGIPVLQLELPEQRWELIRTTGEPPLPPRIFLIGRDDACDKLKEVFEGTADQLKLETHFPEQVVDFVCAYLADLDAETHAEVTGRCLIVSGVDAWDAMASYKEKLVLIADPVLDLSGDFGAKLIQKARKAGHAVIFGGSLRGIPDPMSALLPAPRKFQVLEALEKAGYNEERARALTQKSGGNLGSLLRCLQNLSLMPEWAESSFASELAIAAALGSWSENSPADRAIVESLSGSPYEEWIGKMRVVALRPGTPITQRDGNWRFTARYEGWYALGQYLFDEHLDRLRDAAISVLTERDPQFDLPGDERYMVSIHGQVLLHTHLLRNGLAEALALLGSHPRALTSCTLGKAKTTAVLAVRELLADAMWERWASLNQLLPLLAEAAPGEFLDAVEKALRVEPSPFDRIFAAEGNGTFGRTYMTGVLWALETLAWDPDYLSSAVICLGELAARDPGGEWANRPASSLTTILLPWLPQTCASVEKRQAAVQALLTELPEVGWKLLISLLPEWHSTSSGTPKPVFRETIPEQWSKGVTYTEYREQVESYSKMAVSVAQSDRNKLTELVTHTASLPPPAQEQLLTYLGSNAVIEMPEADRLNLWIQLRDLVKEHRKFNDARWAMKPELVDRIADIADRIVPESPALRYQYLFGGPDLDLLEEHGTYEDYLKETELRRQKAIEEIVEIGGVPAVLAFAAEVQSPWHVGFTSGVVAGSEANSDIFPELLESREDALRQFARGFVLSRFRRGGWQWVDDIDMTGWTSSQIGQFLSSLPFDQGTWERSARLLGTDEVQYWSRTSANPFETDVSLEPAVDRLVQHGRPCAALFCLRKMLDDKQAFDTELAIRALLAAVQPASETRSWSPYEIREIIKALQNNPATNPDDLFRVEWAYLPLLDRNSGAAPKLLERRLATEPAFFCEVVRLIFRSQNEDRPSEEPTEEERAAATNAYCLLRDWRTPPGLREDGSFDGDALGRWLDAVKAECTETGHLGMGLNMFGHSLVHAPSDPDGLWIHRSVATVLNDRDAEDVRKGFRTELYNSRGVHMIDPSGAPEKELAGKYRAQAEAVENAGYHRLATSLRDLAEIYEREAESTASRECFDD